jgi:calcineurin-like phosphoesterase family protein
MPTTYFTADTHFSHAAIINYAARPFATIEQMDQVLIDNINQLLGRDDVLYHLGDFTLGDYQTFCSYAQRLKQAIRINIVPGGHDRRWIKNFVAADWPNITILPNLTTMENVSPPIVLCHYALRSWDRAIYGTWHLYGHSHCKLPAFGLSYDVGVDCNGFSPISYDAIAKIMETKIKEQDDNPRPV